MVFLGSEPVEAVVHSQGGGLGSSNRAPMRGFLVEPTLGLLLTPGRCAPGEYYPEYDVVRGQQERRRADGSEAAHYPHDRPDGEEPAGEHSDTPRAGREESEPDNCP